MPNPSHAGRELPGVPSLEQQKKQARELLDAARAGDEAALERMRAHHPHLSASDADLTERRLALHHAQLVIAREYGFASWPRLKAHIEAVISARRTRIFVRDVDYHDDRARGLLSVLPDGVPSVIEQVRTWHPRLAGADDETVRSAPFTLEDARLVYAREHGFAAWSRFVDYLEGLGSDLRSEPFLAVFEAGRRGDWTQATAILRAQPDLVRARGTNGNTLLNLACSLSACAPATGGILREVSGSDRLEAVQLLLAAGADPDQPNDRGWTPVHQAAYRNDPEMATLLLDAGARIDLCAHGDGGTPLAVALFWGHREVAATLAERGVVPANLRIAAGLGRRDLVERCLTPAGEPTPEGRAARAFYRPHSGFPQWRPSDDAQEVMDEALVWAAKSGRVETMHVLVERGARPSADPYRGTALLWAACNGRMDAARWLLDHGVDVNQRATFGGPAHGEQVTALHLAAQNDHAEMVKLLLSRGADAKAEDAIYHSTPAGWAAEFRATRALALLEA